jgi:hypothetical protein
MAMVGIGGRSMILGGTDCVAGLSLAGPVIDVRQE